MKHKDKIFYCCRKYPRGFKYSGSSFSVNGNPRGSAPNNTVCCIPVCIGYFPVMRADLDGVQMGFT